MKPELLLRSFSDDVSTPNREFNYHNLFDEHGNFKSSGNYDDTITPILTKIDNDGRLNKYANKIVGSKFTRSEIDIFVICYLYSRFIKLKTKYVDNIAYHEMRNVYIWGFSHVVLENFIKSNINNNFTGFDKCAQENINTIKKNCIHSGQYLGLNNIILDMSEWSKSNTIYSCKEDVIKGSLWRKMIAEKRNSYKIDSVEYFKNLIESHKDELLRNENILAKIIILIEIVNLYQLEHNKRITTCSINNEQLEHLIEKVFKDTKVLISELGGGVDRNKVLTFKNHLLVLVNHENKGISMLKPFSRSFRRLLKIIMFLPPIVTALLGLISLIAIGSTPISLSLSIIGVVLLSVVSAIKWWLEKHHPTLLERLILDNPKKHTKSMTKVITSLLELTKRDSHGQTVLNNYILQKVPRTGKLYKLMTTGEYKSDGNQLVDFFSMIIDLTDSSEMLRSEQVITYDYVKRKFDAMQKNIPIELKELITTSEKSELIEESHRKIETETPSILYSRYIYFAATMNKYNN